MHDEEAARRLVLHGALLFLLGLLTGFVSPELRNSRMGLSAVLLILYAAWVNSASVLLGAATGASRLMPIAGAGHSGPAWAEAVVAFGLFSVAIAMLPGVGLVVWGLARRPRS